MAEAIDASVNLKDFSKCGEITTAIEVGKKVFALNCLFCTTVCMQLEAFAQHIEENHSNELYAYAQSDEEEKEEMEEVEEEELALELQEMEPAKYNLNLDDNFFKIKLPKKPAVEETNLRDEEAVVQVLKEKLDTTTESEDPLRELNTKRTCRSSGIAEKKHEETLLNTTPLGLEISKEMLDSINNDNDDEMVEMDINCNNDETQLGNNTESSDSASDSETEDDNDDDIFNDDDAASKDLLLEIIAGYEKHPILWDPSDINAKNRKKREEALKNICQVVKRKLSITLSIKTIGDHIKKLRYKYRSELQQRKQAEAKDDVLPCSAWYFDKLAFLDKTIAYKPRNKRGTKALSNERPSLPLANLTEDQNKKLIEIYKSFPCLWDMQHIGFRFKNQRTEALNKMNQAIKNKMKLNFKPEELQRKLYRIRYACTQEKHRKLQCERMNKPFKAATKYYERIAFLLDNVGPFKCDFCEKVFNGADQYRIHKSSHDGSMPFICPICNRGFMKVGNCTVHLRRHTRDYPFECKECGKRFATTTDVNVHMRYHTGEKPYFCEICGRSFRTWSFFDAHMRRHQKRPNHTCTICSKAFYENNKLTEHMKAHLNVRDKVCNICGKAFTSTKYLRQHKQIHAEKKQYTCKICNKDFAQYAGLSGHMKSHGTTVNGGAVSVESEETF